MISISTDQNTMLRSEENGLVQADRKVTAAQTATLYHHGEQKTGAHSMSNLESGGLQEQKKQESEAAVTAYVHRLTDTGQLNICK